MQSTSNSLATIGINVTFDKSKSICNIATYFYHVEINWLRWHYSLDIL